MRSSAFYRPELDGILPEEPETGDAKENGTKPGISSRDGHSGGHAEAGVDADRDESMEAISGPNSSVGGGPKRRKRAAEAVGTNGVHMFGLYLKVVDVACS